MIYFDHAATGLVHPEVLKLEIDAESTFFANPNSLHQAGYQAKKALEDARKKMLNLFGLASTHELVFTSGATEANNYFCKGVAEGYSNRGRRILTTNAEHPSIQATMYALRDKGFDVIEMPVNEEGKLEPSTLEQYIDKNTILVSIIGVNNEVGAISDLPALSKIVKRFPKCFFHSDLTQAIGKVKIDYSCLDAFSFSGHKFGARKGIGGIVFKKNIHPESLLSGGHQENGYRGGTVNLSGALGMAKALELSLTGLDQKIANAKELNDYAKNLLLETNLVHINSPKDGCPFILNFSLDKHKASVIIEALSNQGIYLSSVSACSSKQEPVSHVLLAMNKSHDEAANSMRMSFGYESSKEQVDAFIKVFTQLLQEVHTR